MKLHFTPTHVRRSVFNSKTKNMRKTFPLLTALAVVTVLSSGCAKIERKFGRGVSNVLEPVRLGEMRRSVEQTALNEGPEVAYTYGFFRGLNRTLARTGVGIYEMVCAPFPPYDPVWTSYLTPNAPFPDNYRPMIMEDSLFATDTNLGFSGGDVAPYVPGSRFRIFDTH
jgi:putative exosortase-associated protein (TIGR04073 family)